MNPAPAHLEAKLRFWELTVGQIAAAFAGILIGVVWAKFLCPFDGMWAALSGTYIAALLVVPVFVASQTEFDLWGLVSGALRWRRLDGRYVPGAGSGPAGYLLTRDSPDLDTTGDPRTFELDLEALWGDA